MSALEQKLLHALTADAMWDGRAPTVVRLGTSAELAVPMPWIAEQDSALVSQLLSIGSLPGSGFLKEAIVALVCDRAYPALLDAWLELGQDQASRAGYRAHPSSEYDTLFTPSIVRLCIHLKTVERMFMRRLGLPGESCACTETMLALGSAVRVAAMHGLRLLDRDLLICALLRAFAWDGEAKAKADALHVLLMRGFESSNQDGENGRLPALPVAEVKISDALMSGALVDCFVLDQSPAELLGSLAPGCLPLQELLQTQAAVPAPAASAPRSHGATRKAPARNDVPDLDTMAMATPTTVRLADVVLPPPTLAAIQDLVAAIQNRNTVLQEWGFGERLEYGTGIIACFEGESGLGKTFAARAVANESSLALRVVKASEVQSHLVGQAEKNIETLFSQVAPETLLLIDEADTLFSSRRAGGSHHDLYINSQINQLLSAVESFSGALILTTNCIAAFDDAFARRIGFRVHFQRPDETARERLWRRLLAAPTPLAADINFRAIAAEHSLTGGEIRNAVLRAAFVAAAAKTAISMAMLRREASAVVGTAARKSIGFTTPERLVDLSMA
jgi:hypothetical protein